MFCLRKLGVCVRMVHGSVPETRRRASRFACNQRQCFCVRGGRGGPSRGQAQAGRGGDFDGRPCQRIRAVLRQEPAHSRREPRGSRSPAGARACPSSPEDASAVGDLRARMLAAEQRAASAEQKLVTARIQAKAAASPSAVQRNQDGQDIRTRDAST